MKSFSNNQKVKVIDADHFLSGKSGVVVRCRIGDNGAWVHMDEPLSDELASFPKGDSRRDHYLLYPDQCEQA